MTRVAKLFWVCTQLFEGIFDAVQVKSQGGKEKQYTAKDDEDLFVIHRKLHYTPVIYVF